MTRQIKKNPLKRHFHCSLTFHRVQSKGGGAAQFISFWRKQITPQEHTEAITGIPEEFFFLWNRNGALEIGGRRRTLEETGSLAQRWIALCSCVHCSISARNQPSDHLCVFITPRFLSSKAAEMIFLLCWKVSAYFCCQVVIIGYKSNRKKFFVTLLPFSFFVLSYMPWC